MCAGYCSLVHFSEADLGTPLAAEKVPPHIQPLMKAAAKAAAPATPEQLAPTKAPRKGQPQDTPGTAPKPEQTVSAQGINAVQAVPDSDRQQAHAAAPAGSAGRPEALEQHPAGGQPPGSQSAQEDLTGFAQDRPSQASAPPPEPTQAEQASAMKRPLTGVAVGQPAQTEAGYAGSAVKKQKRIVPTAMASAFSAPLAARSGKVTYCTGPFLMSQHWLRINV